MGIPQAAFEAGDLYIEYGFEEMLFRYEKVTGRFFGKFYNAAQEHEVPQDNNLLCEARCSGVLTTAERYSAGGAPAPVTPPSAAGFSTLAVAYQRIRPYWLSVKYRNSHTRAGDIEVGVDGRLEVLTADDSIKQLLEDVVAELNRLPGLPLTSADGAAISVSRQSADYDFGLRLELKNREFSVTSESSFYQGRSRP